MTESQKGPQRQRPPQNEAMSKMMRFQMIYMLISLVSIFIITNNTMRAAIGNTLGIVLFPLVGFNFQLPLLTIILVGVIIGLLTSIPRYFFTDWVKMGKIQNRMSAFNKVMSTAYRSNQRDKIQKLQKMRMEMSMEQTTLSMNTMKPLLAFTIVTLFLIAWLYYFLSELAYQVIAFPWNFEINVATAHIWIMPYWIVVYFFAIMVFGYIVTMFIKYFDFTYKIRKFERTVEYENND